jgi:outer membrane protein TolC
LSNAICIAQVDSSFSSLRLPNLSTLIDSAYNNSPLLQSQELKLSQKEILTKIEKKMWMKSLSFNSNYSRGTNNSQIDGIVIPTYTQTSSNWYNTGLSLNISLSTILNRKNVISISKINYTIEENKLEEAKRSLRKIILELYTLVLMNEKILKIRNNAVIISRMNFSYAELEYKNNSISLADYSRIHEGNIKSNILYEESKRDYLLSISILEETVGIKLR